MSTVTVNYRLSDAARRRIAIETGEEPAREQTLLVDLLPLSPAQRELLLDARDSSGDLNLKKIEPVSYAEERRPAWYESFALFENFLTLEDVLRALTLRSTLIAQAEQHQRELRAKANFSTAEQARSYLSTPETENQPGYLIHNPSLWPDAPGYPEASELIQQVQAEYARRYQLMLERHEAEKTEAETRRQAIHAARLAWAREHGSDQLRRGLEAGHTCTRIYWVERAAVEYPGYVLDYAESADWKDRVCPGIAALDERDAVLGAHLGVTAKVVWLIQEPHDNKTDELDHEFEEVEAIVVDDESYEHHLVKTIGDRK